MTGLSLSLLLSLAGAGPPETPAPLPRLLVMGLEVTAEVDAATAPLLDELILTDLQRSGLFEVIGGSDLKALVSNEQQKLLVGCNDTACLTEVAGALDTDLLALSSLG